MRVEYFGLDQKAKKTPIISGAEERIEKLQNTPNPQFKFLVKGVREVDLLEFRDVFISAEGAVFKGFSLSQESIFHDGLKPNYQNKLRFFKKNYLNRRTIKIKKALYTFDPWSLLNYHHWMCDAMMRVAACEDFFCDLVLIVPYAKYRISDDVLLNSLKAFGFDSSRILRLDKKQKVRVEEMIMPSHTTQSEAIYFREKLVDKVRAKISGFFSDELKNEFGERVYISRAKANYRRISNEDEVIKLLQKFGFKVVNMESLSFAKQVDVANHAKIMISSHGAGLANILFMKPGSQVLELIHEKLNRPHFYSLASSARVNYSHLACKHLGEENFHDNIDIHVDLCELEKRLNSLIASI